MNMRFFIFALLSMLLALSSGCTSAIKSNYARTHTLPPIGAHRTYAFNTDTERHDTLEYGTYCKQVAAVLDEYGWRLVTVEKGNTQKPDYWVSIVYGYALSPSLGNGMLARTAAPAQVGNASSLGTENFAKVAAYYTAINITTLPMGAGDAVFTSQIYGASDAEIIWVVPAMLKQLLSDFPGEDVTSRDVTLHTGR